jgi:hypothetical protein
VTFSALSRDPTVVLLVLSIRLFSSTRRLLIGGWKAYWCDRYRLGSSERLHTDGDDENVA